MVPLLRAVVCGRRSVPAATPSAYRPGDRNRMGGRVEAPPSLDGGGVASDAEANPRGGLAATGRAELAQDVVHVGLDRRHADIEARRDVLVGQALVDEPEDLGLPRGQASVGA